MKQTDVQYQCNKCFGEKETWAYPGTAQIFFVFNDRVCFLCTTFCSHYDDVTGRWTQNAKHVREEEQKTMSLTRRGPTAAKQVLPLRGELMVLLQGGVNLFQGGVLPPPTGWLDKPLVSGTIFH